MFYAASVSSPGGGRLAFGIRVVAGFETVDEIFAGGYQHPLL